jgi:hypothetical protein
VQQQIGMRAMLLMRERRSMSDTLCSYVCYAMYREKKEESRTEKVDLSILFFLQ